jgi:hypothetical protein
MIGTNSLDRMETMIAVSVDKKTFHIFSKLQPKDTIFKGKLS